MKKQSIFIIVFLVLMNASCVQKSYTKTVVFYLDVKGIKNVKKVGIRGNDKPLSWDYDYDMQLDKDSVYKATLTDKTGYKFTTVKFTINGNFELKDKDNRKVYFSNKDTTVYRAKFDKIE
ncbi:hypothetical protein [Flavobacterium restrictum]|uniref:Oxidoreductase n=1 Tax=Flavobacterium restrictum TaxID=2594428 RepID=A0A553E971_9FLAO|nr:hypothetical protein [Flavobacterium restrictum]TRX41550.1 hypothetical protein FNW21_05500 [Flavobacterium restrictum]